MSTATEAPSWQRPPFEPGHQLSVRHGANSDVLVIPEAERLMPAVLDANPHLDPIRDSVAVKRYCVIQSRIWRVYDWLAAQEDAVFDDVDQGTIHAAYERLERWERQADAAEEKLALTPLTRLRYDLDRLRAGEVDPEEIERQREARERLDRRVADLGGPRPDPRTAVHS